MSRDTSTEYAGPNAFVEFAEEASDGAFRADVSRDFLALVKQCAEQALAQGSVAKGKLTLELNFHVDPRGEVDFTYSTKVKNPPKPTQRGRLWIGRGGGMTAVHPKQLEISGTEKKRRAEPPPETGRREATPEEADDGDDTDGLH
jgi:hypothetical protein